MKLRPFAVHCVVPLMESGEGEPAKRWINVFLAAAERYCQMLILATKRKVAILPFFSVR